MFVQGVYPSNTANITFSNYYGLLMNPLDEWGGVTFTNRWGIYQSGASDKNYFNGNLLVKSTTDNGSALQVTGAATFNGNVGIGTATPAWPLDVFSSNGDVLRINKTGVAGTGAASGMSFQVTQSNGQSARLGLIGTEFMSNWGGDMIFYTKPSNGNPDNSTSERMRLNSSGSLFVGGGTPNDVGERSITVDGSGVPAASLYLRQIWNGTAYPAIIQATKGSTYLKLLIIMEVV
jgi:hypothetical protein